MSVWFTEGPMRPVQEEDETAESAVIPGEAWEGDSGATGPDPAGTEADMCRPRESIGCPEAQC